MHKSSSGAVYNLKIHLVIATKYRYKVINAPMLKRLKEIFAATCVKWECTLVQLNGEADHIHALIDLNPKVAPSKFVNNLKTVSSRLIRKEFGEHLSCFYKKPVLWSIGYAVNSCGGASIDKIKDYIKNQNAPISSPKIPLH